MEFNNLSQMIDYIHKAKIISGRIGVANYIGNCQKVWTIIFNTLIDTDFHNFEISITIKDNGSKTIYWTSFDEGRMKSVPVKKNSPKLQLEYYYDGNRRVFTDSHAEYLNAVCHILYKIEDDLGYPVDSNIWTCLDIANETSIP